MFLISGLGNPGANYKWTRHNVGFEAIGKLAYDHNIPMTGRKCRAITGSGFINGKKVMLSMPQTYMNLSGESIRDLMSYYNIQKEDLTVIYDDTAVPLGGIRVRDRGSAGGHNGMKSIIYQLDTDMFPRVRIGIGEKPPAWDLADYVLSRFSDNERDDIILGITNAADAAIMLLDGDINAVMNKYNRKAVN